MGSVSGLLGCGAYITGLCLVSLWVRHGGLGLWVGVVITGLMAMGLATMAALTMPQRWSLGPRPSLWLGLGGLGLVAALNYGLQYPTPSVLDISHLIQPGPTPPMQQEVWGRVTEMPKISRSGKGQFWLQTQQVQTFSEADRPLGPRRTTEGLLYVTVPSEAIDDLYPGQTVRVRGQIYAPSKAKNPNAFDFQQYLASRDTYAGFRGRWVTVQDEAGWGLWRIRQRIARAHRQGLGSEQGALVSAMALGRQAVQVPYTLQDAFIQAGLAHTLAASGFQVSLLLGLVMGLLRWPALQSRLAHPGVAQIGLGSTVLVSYVLMTGVEPSVMRAALMGLGALVGLVLGRGVKPLGCLLLAATLLLIWNPSWIDDIGFRLSVMATLGLMVSVKPITTCLRWLPPTLATPIAVPLAAYFWTIPLSLYYFNTLTTYSLPLNMVVTPLVTLISLGGLISGLIALILPSLGSALAALLGFPTTLLITLVNWEIHLPNSSLAMGHLALWQMISLYGLYVLGGWSRLGRRRRWLVALLMVGIALGPLWYRGATLNQVTVLATGKDAVMVVQDRRSTLLINSGTGSTAFYTVGPFLRQAGVNHLPYAIAGQSSDADNWKTLMAQAPIQAFYYTHRLSVPPRDIPAPRHLGLRHPLTLDHHRVESLSETATALRLTLFHRHTWLMLTHLSPTDQQTLAQSTTPLTSDVLWWDGQPLQANLIAAIRPRIAIASSRTLAPEIRADLQQRGIQVWCTEQDGAILWQPRQGYHSYLTMASSPQTAWD